MKTRVLLVSAVIASALSACGGSSGNNDNVHNVNFVDKTDVSRCQGPATSISAIGVWTAQMASEDGQYAMTQTLQIDNSATNATIANTCSAGTDVAIASVNVPASVTSGTLSLLRGDRVSSDQGSVHCEVSVEAGSYNYQLAGDCIVLQIQGRTMHMVRMR